MKTLTRTKRNNNKNKYAGVQKRLAHIVAEAGKVLQELRDKEPKVKGRKRKYTKHEAKPADLWNIIKKINGDFTVAHLVQLVHDAKLDMDKAQIYNAIYALKDKIQVVRAGLGRSIAIYKVKASSA